MAVFIAPPAPSPKMKLSTAIFVSLFSLTVSGVNAYCCASTTGVCPQPFVMKARMLGVTPEPDTAECCTCVAATAADCPGTSVC
ncbi:hypothetical protein DL93DRAFT_2079012 [Clavulina sp. PMI_390]|nr:hypothetical protein DL93DRAFT_2079012 [Clavulina sp. PMI_390]